MSRKHNTKHTSRGRSNYPNRPRIFGLGGSRQMEGLDTLRKRQAARIKNTCTLHSEHNASSDSKDCNGQPWYVGGSDVALTREEALLTEIFSEVAA